MSFISNFVVVALLVVGSASAQNPLSPIALPSQENLARLFFSSSITRRDPQLSVACFGGYISESNVISHQYSGGYSRCLSDAQAGRRTADREFRPALRKIQANAEQVCRRLSECSGQNATLEAFRCHANGGNNNTVATYTISSNASEQASQLQERYRVIDLRYNQCIVVAERLYVQTSASNYKYLQACLDGRVPPKQVVLPPTTTSTSTTTTTTTTTTEAPPSTTEPPTTTPSPADLEDQFKQLLNLLN